MGENVRKRTLRYDRALAEILSDTVFLNRSFTEIHLELDYENSRVGNREFPDKVRVGHYEGRTTIGGLGRA